MQAPDATYRPKTYVALAVAETLSTGQPFSRSAWRISAVPFRQT